jgi:chromosome segregation ATPase
MADHVQLRNGQSRVPAAVPAAEDIATSLTVAQQRAAEQRAAVEKLLAESRAIEDRLAIEARQARAVAARYVIEKQSTVAAEAAQREAEAAASVNACSTKLESLSQACDANLSALETARAAQRVSDAAVADLEQKLTAARAEAAASAKSVVDLQAQSKELTTRRTAAEFEANTAATRLGEHQLARRTAETALADAQERLHEYGDDAGAALPSLAAIADLKELETRIATTSAAAQRAAERRAADAARSR